MASDSEDWVHKRWVFEQEQRQAEQKQRLAEREHDRNSDNVVKQVLAAVESGHHALRAILLINGGAAVALLAFIGAIASKEGVSSVADLAATIQWFAFGVAVSAAAIGMAYLVNHCYAISLRAMENDWDHPYVKETPSSKRWERGADVLNVSTILTALVALGLFVYGMLNVQNEVAKLRLKAPTTLSAPLEKEIAPRLAALGTRLSGLPRATPRRST